MKDGSRFGASASWFFLQGLCSTMFTLRVGGFEGGDSLVCCKGKPLAVVKVAGTKSFLHGVFEALLWCSSVALVSSDLW